MTVRARDCRRVGVAWRAPPASARSPLTAGLSGRRSLHVRLPNAQHQRQASNAFYPLTARSYDVSEMQTDRTPVAGNLDMESGRRVQVDLQTLGDLRDAPTSLRVFAALIDLFLAMVVSGLLLKGWGLLIAESVVYPPAAAWTLSALVLVAFPYYTVCEILWGQTIGKALVEIRVVSLTGNMNRWRILVRNLVRITWAVPFLGFLFLLADVRLIQSTEKHQRLGDIVAGTHVVRTSVKVAHK